MSLNLDTRQRAMLAEMGVRVWWPKAAATAAAAKRTQDTPADTASTPNDIVSRAVSAYPERASGQFDPDLSTPAPVAAPALAAAGTPAKTLVGAPPGLPPARPSTLAPLPEGVAQMNWTQLHQAVAHCQACPMCLGRQQPVFVPPPAPQRCDWLVLGDPPDDAQERAGLPFVQDAGQLLDKMLQALGVQRLSASSAEIHPRETSAYLSLVLKCRPMRPTVPDAATLNTCAHFLRREIALIEPKVILAMGRFALQLLLSEDHPEGVKLPLGKLRGQVWHFAGVPVVVTYPSAYLLRNGADKARAWQDLCLAADIAQASATAA